MDYDFYVFDCDGVILNSNKIKSDAFVYALEGYKSEEIYKLVSYHKENGGESRYKKFEYFFNGIHPVENSENYINNALDRFSSYVYKNLLECEYVPGVINFLKQLNSNNSKCFVNSGSDQEELIEIFNKREISSFFQEIYGSPNTKNFNNNKIIQSIDQKEKGVFFGDSALDYQTAKDFNLDFIYIFGYSEWKNPQGNFKKELRDFTGY